MTSDRRPSTFSDLARDPSLRETSTDGYTDTTSVTTWPSMGTDYSSFALPVSLGRGATATALRGLFAPPVADPSVLDGRGLLTTGTLLTRDRLATADAVAAAAPTAWRRPWADQSLVAEPDPVPADDVAATGELDLAVADVGVLDPEDGGTEHVLVGAASSSWRRPRRVAAGSSRPGRSGPARRRNRGTAVFGLGALALTALGGVGLVIATAVGGSQVSVADGAPALTFGSPTSSPRSAGSTDPLSPSAEVAGAPSDAAVASAATDPAAVGTGAILAGASTAASPPAAAAARAAAARQSSSSGPAATTGRGAAAPGAPARAPGAPAPAPAPTPGSGSGPVVVQSPPVSASDPTSTTTDPTTTVPPTTTTVPTTTAPTTTAPTTTAPTTTAAVTGTPAA